MRPYLPALLLAVALGPTGCDGDAPSAGDTAPLETDADAGADGDDAVDEAATCDELEAVCVADEAVSCERLFGLPSEKTGLEPGACAPSCACSGVTWEVPTYDTELLARLRAMRPLDPSDRLTTDPYETPELHVAQPDKACGLRLDPGDPTVYALETFDSPQAARDAGAIVTHHGACGLCSSLQDLAVYIGVPDLTTPVRACGLLGFQEGDEAQRECLLDIGFTEPCADIWFYNTNHTRQVCLGECLTLLDAPYHRRSGAPNDCIQCDEDKSGPVFKAVSGRTRRNSGLPTALCRPCEGVAAIRHDRVLP